MQLDVGNIIWIPCEVKPGPFADERRVRLSSSINEWVGFVSVSHLQEPILEGKTKVRAIVVGIQENTFSAKVPGESIGTTLFGDLVSKVQSIGSFPTGHFEVHS